MYISFIYTFGYINCINNYLRLYPIFLSIGSYCEGTGNTAVTGDCAVGYYCTLSAYDRHPTDGVTGE